MAARMQATAVAHPNIALIKYWGKRHAALNLPAVGSISLTLGRMSTHTRVRFDPRLSKDELELDGRPADAADLARVSTFLDRVRQLADVRTRARVETRNDFPTGAGLASSASGFAALALAATSAAGLALSREQLGALARLGSGSAARSLHGGFVEMARGEREDGSDAVASPLLAEDAWGLRLLVAVTTVARKPWGSSDGMQRSQSTSPYFEAFVGAQPADLLAMRQAILARDLSRVGELAEHSCLKMHAVMLSTRPPLVYFAPATVAAMHAVHELRRQGTEAYFTIDAGPQVKVLCRSEEAPAVRAALVAVTGVLEVIEDGPGPGARLVEAVA